jgi:hypothetical protein
MARKPNYNFERMERDRAKAEKVKAKARAKSEGKALADRSAEEGGETAAPDDTEQPEGDAVA